jgi:hypothetical protein
MLHSFIFSPKGLGKDGFELTERYNSTFLLKNQYQNSNILPNSYQFYPRGKVFGKKQDFKEKSSDLSILLCGKGRRIC